jgi:LysM repeat protein
VYVLNSTGRLESGPTATAAAAYVGRVRAGIEIWALSVVHAVHVGYLIEMQQEMGASMSSHTPTDIDVSRLRNSDSSNQVPAASLTVEEVTPIASAELSALAEAAPMTEIDTLNGYIVRVGDTCGEIARLLKVRTEDLMVLNGMQGKCLIRPGQVLRISNDVVLTIMPSPTHTPVPTRKPMTTINTSNSYVVKVGETCSGIAKLLNTRLIDLRQANELDERCLLAPGRVLKIP